MLVDTFGREINYLRLSVTDRCDFRCTYCMAEDMVFQPKKDILSFEELAVIAEVFIELGVKKIRVTGGEPLIRRDITTLLSRLSNAAKLDELCITTNASHLTKMSTALKKAGVDRINISLDSLDPQRFRELTRFGKLDKVLHGIETARETGFKQLKLNCVVLKNYNFDEIFSLTDYALNRDIDISFIEEMPLGDIHSHARNVEFVSSAEIIAELEKKFTLKPIKNEDFLAGPSSYWKADNYNAKIGFISPHSNNFCSDCNRVRVTATGRLLLCLGNEHSLDLRKLLRNSAPRNKQPHAALTEAIVNSMRIKPERHTFDLQDEPQILRFMNATGG